MLALALQGMVMAKRKKRAQATRRAKTAKRRKVRKHAKSVRRKAAKRASASAAPRKRVKAESKRAPANDVPRAQSVIVDIVEEPLPGVTVVTEYEAMEISGQNAKPEQPVKNRGAKPPESET